MVVAHLKSRFIANTSNLKVIIAKLDLNTLTGSESREEVGLWMANAVIKTHASELAGALPVLIIVNMIISSKFSLEFSSIATFIDYLGDLEITMSIISPTSVLDRKLSAREGDSCWDSEALELSHSCDVVCFIGGKDVGLSAQNVVRNYCKANNPSAVFMAINIHNIWFDDDITGSLIGSILLLYLCM